MDGFKGDARAVLRNSSQMRRQRLNLETIHRHHIVSVIHQVVCQRVARRTQSHHQNLITTGDTRNRTSIIERIPTSQQRINLKTPRQRQHILENARFHLRNIHRILFLINARLHAVIANAMPRSRQHGIINTRNRQCPDGQRILFCLMHLGYFLLKRTPRQLFAKNIPMKKSLLIFFGCQAFGTRVLALMVTQNAIRHLRQCLTGVIALIGQGKSRARPQMGILIPLRAMSIRQRQQRHSVHGIHRGRHNKNHIPLMTPPSIFRQTRPRAIAARRIKSLLVARFIRKPAQHMVGIHSLIHMHPRLLHPTIEGARQSIPIPISHLVMTMPPHRLLLNEQSPHRV